MCKNHLKHFGFPSVNVIKLYCDKSEFSKPELEFLKNIWGIGTEEE